MKKIFFMYGMILGFFLSCEGDIRREQVEVRTSCDEVMEVIEECLGIPEGSLNYIGTCGSITKSDLDKFPTCDEKIDFILGKDYQE